MPAVEAVEDIILVDGMMDHVHGAVVHDIMFYEDRRSDGDLPVLHNTTIENIVIHEGDYGISLEVFDEVPVTGLTPRNARTDGVVWSTRSMNWKEPVIDNVIINEKSLPRPGGVCIPGVPINGETVKVETRVYGGDTDLMYSWQTFVDGVAWKQAGQGERFPVSGTADFVRATVVDHKGNAETSHEYRIFPKELSDSDWGYGWQRLYCRGTWELPGTTPANAVITWEQFAGMLLPLADPALRWGGEDSEACSETLRITAESGFIALGRRPWPDGHASPLRPSGHVTHQEMATAAMRARDVNYHDAS